LALRYSPKIPEPTRTRVLAAAQTLNYRPPVIYREAMAQIRRRSNPTDRDTLLWLSGTAKHQQTPPMQRLWSAAEQLANEQGYRIEPYHLNDGKGLPNLHRQWIARGIRGGIMLPLHVSLHSVSAEHLAGLRMVTLDEAMEPDMGIARVIPDMETEIINAMRAVELHGYRRPALAYNPWLDMRHTMLRTFEGLRHSMGIQEIPPCLKYHSKATDSDAIQSWWRKYRPDCLLCDNHDALEALGLRAPDDIGFIRLRKQANESMLSGSFLPMEVLGKAAVLHLISLLQHGVAWDMSAVGTLLLPPRWEPGSTLTAQHHTPTNQPIHHHPVFSLANTEQARLLPIPLDERCNQPFRGKYQWFGTHGLHGLQPGALLAAGIPFDVAKGAFNFILLRSSLLVRGAAGPLPGRVLVPLPSTGRIKSLFILHTCAHAAPGVFAKYRLHYSDGSVVEQPVACPSDADTKMLPVPPPADALVHDWWPNTALLHTSEVLPVSVSLLGNQELYGCHLYVWRWRNPHPERTIVSLEVQADPSAKTMLGLLGLTVLPSA
jgi:DNA-binding LacI/PurR family transcriptional regulator